MRHLLTVSIAAIALAGLAQAPVAARSRPAPAPAPPVEAAPLADLVRAVDLPFERFTLDNGLTTIVHTDRKAPVVGVMIYYRVGSKHEPRGRTGFAHLYEHLFFGGSENAPSFDKPLEAAGATGTNGTTWYDRTNYLTTVPKGALELALFLESDRMGHLMGTVSQATLDQERDIVKNEKRQRDNQPYALMEEYAVAEGLFPVGHPYRHSTIGSMADLDAATLEDVRRWYVDHYGPNNVVLALAGDIDAATARPLVQKWFGHIPRGPEVKPVSAEPVTMAAPVRREMTDQVPVARLTRTWSGPGLNHADAPALDLGLRVLGGLASSRLDNILVRGEQLAVAVTASAQQFEQVSFLQATMDVKPGVDRAAAEARFDAVLADYIASGPNEDELRRAATAALAGQISALERVGGFSGKSATLAEGQLYSGDPAKFRADLERMARLTPQEVRGVLQRWLSRPVLAINTLPGERTEQGDAMGGWGDEGTTAPPPPDPRKPAPPAARGPARTAPPVAPVADLQLPALERATLSNGIPVVLARRTAVPKALVSLQFDSGIAADALDGAGTQGFLLDMLDEGTGTRTATRIAEEQELLGARIETGAGRDRSAVTLSALTPNLAPSLALMADVVRNPAFADAEVSRVRARRLSDLAQAEASPDDLALRETAGLLFGADSPYGQPGDGLGRREVLASIGPDSLRAAHRRWLRPDLARITVVGDVTMERLKPLLETAFGNWKAARGTPAQRPQAAAPAARPSRVVLLDRPNSPQSFIVAARVLPVTGRTAGMEALDLANEVLGGGSLQTRLNADLRVAKGWSYGAFSQVSAPAGPRTFLITAPVQADRTGDSIRAIQANLAALSGDRPVSADELERVTEGYIRGLPNRFETNDQVLRAILTNDLLGRPDDYHATLPARYRAMDAAALDAAARAHLGGDGLVFIVAGDRKTVEPQLAGLGLPVEVRAASALAD